MAVVPATRRSVAAPQPRRTPATRERRPQLRVVDAPARHLNLGALTVLIVGAIFAVLFGLVVFHTLLLKNQRRPARRIQKLSTQVLKWKKLVFSWRNHMPEKKNIMKLTRFL